MEIQFQFNENNTGETSCRICGESATISVAWVTGAPIEGGRLELVRCSACLSLSYAAYDPAIEKESKGFPERDWVHCAQTVAGIGVILEPLLRLRPSGGRLLHVGCGFGFVAHFWETSGRGVAVGLEDSQYGQIGRKKLGVDVRQSHYAALKGELDGNFRYLLASDVIEHVPDPKAFLAEVSAALSEDGILVLTTPAAEGVVENCDPAALLASLSLGYQYFFSSRMGLAHLLRQSGFRHVRVEANGARLSAWASRQPLPDLAPAGQGWDDCINYLELLAEHPDHHLAGGARYRVFKEALKTKDATGAEKGWLRIQSLAQNEYQINLTVGTSVAASEMRDVTSHGLKIRDYSKSPAWLGCATFFGAQYRDGLGELDDNLIPPLCSAIAELGRDLDDHSHFAQESAEVLAQARILLARVLARNKISWKAQDTGAYAIALDRCEVLAKYEDAQTAEYLLWRALAEAVVSGAGAETEACFWLALAKNNKFDFGSEVREVCMEAATARKPQDAELQADLALLAFSRGAYRRAYNAFRMASAADPLNPTHWSNAATCAFLLSCFRLARNHARTALSYQPGHLVARKTLAESELSLDRPDAAQAALAQMPSWLRTEDPDVRLLEIGITIAKDGLEIGLFDLASLAEAAPNDELVQRKFHEATRRFGKDPALAALFDDLGLNALDHAVSRPAGFRPIDDGHEYCDVVILVDLELVHLRSCLDSLALHGGGLIGRVFIVAPSERLALADLDDLPFQISQADDRSAALHATTSRYILLMCAEVKLLAESIGSLFRSLDTSQTAALAAALPLGDPIPAATLAGPIRNWTHGAADISAPTLPAACLLIRRTALEAIGPLEPGPITSAIFDLCLRAIDSGFKPVFVLDAPVILRAGLNPPDRSFLYARHSALRVLAAESLFDMLEPYVHLRLKIQDHMGLMAQATPQKEQFIRTLKSLEETVATSRDRKAPSQLLSTNELLALIVSDDAVSYLDLMISVSHDSYLESIGGVQICIQREADVANSNKFSYLHIYPWYPLPRLAHMDEENDIIVCATLNGKQVGACRTSALIAAMKELNQIGRQGTEVVVHHLLGHLPEQIVELAQSAGSGRCVFWLHDFFSLCPSFTLVRNGLTFCNAPRVISNSCTVCVFGKERAHHLARIQNFFEALRVDVASPSKVTADFWRARSDLPIASMNVIPHTLLRYSPVGGQNLQRQRRSIRIGFLGSQAHHKGWDAFKKLMLDPSRLPDLEFVVLSSSPPLAGEDQWTSVKVSAEQPDAMATAVEEEDIDVVLHWPAGPETFSLTTFEALAGSAFIVTNSWSGNVAEAVRLTDHGVVLHDEAALTEFFQTHLLRELVEKRRLQSLRFRLCPTQSDQSYTLLRKM